MHTYIYIYIYIYIYTHTHRESVATLGAFGLQDLISYFELVGFQAISIYLKLVRAILR